MFAQCEQILLSASTSFQQLTESRDSLNKQLTSLQFKQTHLASEFGKFKAQSDANDHYLLRKEEMLEEMDEDLVSNGYECDFPFPDAWKQQTEAFENIKVSPLIHSHVLTFSSGFTSQRAKRFSRATQPTPRATALPRTNQEH